jgi:gluconolactonase
MRLAYRLPDALRRHARTPWSDANRPGELLHSVLEGPCFDALGRLYVVDIPFGRVFRVGESGWDVVAEYDGWPNGLKPFGPDQLLAADYKNGLVRINSSNGTVEPLLATMASEAFKGLNDLTIAHDGSVLFTDQGQTGLHDPTGRVWRLRPSGQLDRLISNAPSPNGIVLNASNTHAYVAMTRSCQIWRFEIRADGLVNKVQCFAQLPGGLSGPDGLVMDGHDRLFVCDPAHACIWMLDRYGIPTARFDSCAGRVLTNAALSPDERELFITDAETGSILICDVPPP